MNKLLVLAALTVAAAPAMASKARLTALGNANHLIDTQTVFTNAADINYLGDYATIEFGSNANNSGSGVTTPRAEGGFTRTSSMGKWGAYLGRQSSTVNEFIAGVNAAPTNAGLLTEQNALDLMYGTEMAGQKWGFGAHYSAAKLESTSQEVNTLGVSAGVRNDVWDAYLRVGLGGESKVSGASELKQKGLYDVGFGYWLDTVYLSAKYITTKGTLSGNPVLGGTDLDIEKNAWSVSAIDNMKVEGGNFFYGISYTSNEVKKGNNKETTTGLPLIAGMEIDAASWMVLRGSISQNVFVGEVKNDPGSTDKMANNTVVAAGAGIKFGKMTMDATISGSGTTSGTADGTVNGNNLFTQGSLTYMF
ncbi:hypothetical protein [Bdellovibrio bacteriovorus]|nr:hypothetical protein [Bdellovibrio bacteriovorus]